MCLKNNNVYKVCPVFENEEFLLRKVELNDSAALLKVYSDKKAVEFFNSDNCGGDTFYYTTVERMQEAIEYWLWEYGRKGFVRWSVVDKENNEAIGTIELFNRKADDYFTDCGLLRLDLRSDYETEEAVTSILSLIIESAYILFRCKKIATKAVPNAKERIKALEFIGFVWSDEILIGHDGTEYTDYFVLEK